MIYVLLKSLFQLTIDTFFKVLKVDGKKNVPESGPVIFIANHPSTLMDPVVIAIILKRPVFFLAAAEFMGKGLVTRFMQSFLNMIPVYRPDTLPGDANKNKDVFFKCFEHLKNDGCILIFPEGSSVTENRLRPLKTGAARIALGAQKAGSKTVQIVPIGLNYSNPHQFRSELFVNIGKPINENHPSINGDLDDFEKARILTQVLEDELKDNLIHVEDEQFFELFEKVKKVVIHEQQNLDGKVPEQNLKFKLSQEIQEGLSFYGRKHPEVLMELSRMLDQYIERVDFYQVSDASIAKGQPYVRWRDYGKLVLGMPIFLLGYFTNFLPYHVTNWVFDKLKVEDQFRGSIGMTLGLVFFLVWYISLGIIIANVFSGWWYGLIGVIAIFLLGRFTLRFLSLVNGLRQTGKLKRIFKRKRNVFEQLAEEREAIINFILTYSNRDI